MKEEQNIKCPKCQAHIDVSALLYDQLNAQLSNDYEKKHKALAEKEEVIKETIEANVSEKLSIEKQHIEKRLRNELLVERSAEIEIYKNQLQTKSDELKEYYRTKAELEQLKREKDELQEKIVLESELKYSIKLTEERKKLKEEVEYTSGFKLKEKEHIIEQLKVKLSEAMRKSEQGSTQLQGEIQELAIEDHLKLSFPSDEILEIKKGIKGADCLQIINSTMKQNCGSIYYESKRTKEFQQSWIETFKNDLRAVGATFGVLVTSALPKGVDRMTQINGIWVCTYNEFKGLCTVLRQTVLMVDAAYTSQENKGDKMVMLYNFLTAPEFRLTIEALVDGFTTMSMDLQKEKRAIENLWSKREKMIQKVLLNTGHLYSSIKGIAGNAVLPIQSLDFPENQDNNE